MIAEVKRFKFKFFKEKNGTLIAYEFKDLNFSIKRIFQVFSKKNQNRGRHAHKNSAQILICTKGKVLIKCSDGRKSKKFILDNPGTCLLIPSKIWAEQKYLMKENILTVLCDSFYNKKSYIRNYKNYLDFIKIKK